MDNTPLHYYVREIHMHIISNAHLRVYQESTIEVNTAWETQKSQ